MQPELVTKGRDQGLIPIRDEIVNRIQVRSFIYDTGLREQHNEKHREVKKNKGID